MPSPDKIQRLGEFYKNRESDWIDSHPGEWVLITPDRNVRFYDRREDGQKAVDRYMRPGPDKPLGERHCIFTQIPRQHPRKRRPVKIRDPDGILKRLPRHGPITGADRQGLIRASQLGKRLGVREATGRVYTTEEYEERRKRVLDKELP